MTQPHAAYSGRRDEHPAQAQGIAGALLTIGGILEGKGHHRLLDVLRNPVAQIGTTAAGFSQGFDASFFMGFFDPVKRVPAAAHHAAGFRDALKIGG